MKNFSLANIKMTYKLPGMFIACALVATLAVGISSFMGGTGIVQDLSSTELQALQTTRYQAIGDYLGTIEQDMRFIAASPLTQQALLE
jgi:methyl-accepting chemotaxis protein